MILSFRARICGLVCVCILSFLSCSTNEKKVEQAIIFQYPKDSLWRGIPLKKNQELYKKNSFPAYCDSVLISADNRINFNYYAGIPEKEVPDLLKKISKQQYVNYTYLYSLGVPSDKQSREKLKYLNLRGRNLHQIPYELSV